MPELTVRVLDGDSDRVLGRIGLTFSSPVREQLVIDRLARLFDIEPLGGQLGVYLDQATAPGNATSLRQLCSGNNAGIDLPVKQRPIKVPKTEAPPRSSDATYQRIVMAVREALSNTEPSFHIGKLETNPAVFSSAINAVSEQATTQYKILEQVRTALSEVNSSVHDIDAMPQLVRELVTKVASLESKLEDCNYDRDNLKSSLAEHEAKYTMLRSDFQRLVEESNQQDLAQQLADIDMFDDKPFPSSDQGAI